MSDCIFRELDQNLKQHDKITERIDRLEDKIDKNHSELIRILNTHEVEISLSKLKIAMIALISGLIPVSIKEVIEKFF